ncbi:FKBP-type peptidyl-prolyl cis-trans isomerase [Mucilaginibacter sp. AK015]|uniref:FKBP-type peptidyl-prolyl cis-trans isomerase n=1 Tax=Mucilaginibacter sp. AK015 TaxID=2723072 RepID=UPI00161040E2|nr:FKBP-type peptidyl-prolyl cis-trans isomerase [Mucilaginibacter sp. AK015]MBB5397312.1 FKBP-type peptidyl-prolyl cis-trans isomerase FkpA [Mucilaginibacter sp. AK015]
MKKHFLILSLVLLAFASCKKDEAAFDANAQAAKDETAIQAYLTAHPDINATKDANGIYYQVITEGTGPTATATSTVTVNYFGKLLDGTQFDTGTGLSVDLSGNIIKGWKLGLLHAKAGGRILLIVPSALAYGNKASGVKIPANSVLVFTIDILGIS